MVAAKQGHKHHSQVQLVALAVEAVEVAAEVLNQTPLVQEQRTKDMRVVVVDTLVAWHLAEVVEVAQEQLGWTGLHPMVAMAVQECLRP